MQQNHFKSRWPALLFVAAFSATAAHAQNAAANPSIVYAEITSTLTSSGSPAFEPIPGLTITLPAASAQYNVAIVTLNLPNLYLTQPTTTSAPLSGSLQVVAPFGPAGIIDGYGSISTDIPKLQKSGMKAVSVVVRVPLGTATQAVMAEWASVNGLVNTDTFGSMSAVLGKQ